MEKEQTTSARRTALKGGGTQLTDRSMHLQKPKTLENQPQIAEGFLAHRCPRGGGGYITKALLWCITTQTHCG
jgi:hypothetical protein